MSLCPWNSRGVWLHATKEFAMDLVAMNDCASLTARIERLIQRRTGVGPVLLGPVSDGRVARAEQDLGVTFPPSFRVFLRHFGAGFLWDCEILGLVEEPGHWLDIVQMNRWPPWDIPRHYVLFVYAGGDRGYYLDTSRRDAAGECPVVLCGPNRAGVQVADTFLDFLRKARAGLVD
jgi:hypothetical protein